jgi:SagB-type dehydrogenase family enzyme
VARRDAIRYRRVPHLIAYWRRTEFVVCDYVSRAEIVTAPALVELLDFLGEWRSMPALSRRFPELPADSLRRAIQLLIAAHHVEPSNRRSSLPPGVLASSVWTPEPAFFHFSTKDVQFVSIDGPSDDAGTASPPVRQPSPVKRYSGRRHIELPRTSYDNELSRVLRARRTWRRFGDKPVTREDLATLLDLTFGVQHWVDVPGRPRMALKTSPSGGARHSIEAYVLALDVDGLGRGLYHYSPDRHALVLLKRGAARRIVATYLPVQEGYPNASALIIMTSVFDRVIGRYPYPRAYRSVLIEAGHLCQTFCLVATSLGLAPFCSNAFADSAIERDLKIDGVSEAAIYVAGVGTRPTNTDWAPWTDASWPLPRRCSPRRSRQETLR